jgi:toxin-antitoxin system PIN domain toxin
VIAVDTNVLIHAHREESPFHQVAARCVAELAEGLGAWAIPWPCVHEFLAIVTRQGIFRPPTPLSTALEVVDSWLESPTLVLLTESGQHWREIRVLLATSQVTGGRVHDARIAALCGQHGVRELWSADRDFSRFPNLTVVNPLVRPVR